MKKPGFIINEIHRDAWESLTDEQCGQLLKTLIAYQFDGTQPSELSPELRMAFNFLRPVADKQRTDYHNTCEARRQAANKRWGNEDTFACNSMQMDAKDANKKNRTK